MFQSSPGVKVLFYINVIAFLVLSIFSLIGLNLPILSCWGVDSPNFHLFQLITYQFIHGGIFHLLTNMIVLVSIGPEVEGFIGNTRKFYFYYLLMGIIGGILQSFMSICPCVGASGSVWGLLMMYVFLFPNNKISILFIPFGIKSKYIIGTLFVIELISCIISYNYPLSDNVAHWAHLGGSLSGIMIYLYERKVLNNRNV